jgi:hypothetical protein
MALHIDEWSGQTGDPPAGIAQLNRSVTLSSEAEWSVQVAGQPVLASRNSWGVLRDQFDLTAVVANLRDGDCTTAPVALPDASTG